MIVASPIAGVQAGQAAGGGLFDSIKNAISGATGSTQQSPAAPKGDGSVGLFDGVFKKALISGGIGAAVGFLPFIPGGPVIGGLLGALGGAAMQVFSNWRTMQTIKQENAAMLGALGVQTNDPQVQQILQSGNVQQLIPLMQQQAAVQQQQALQQSLPVGTAGQSSAATPAQRIAQVYDPSTGITRLVDLDTGQVVQQSGSTSTGQTPLPTQGGIAAAS